MIRYSIPDMSCGHCKATVDKTVKALDPHAVLQFDMGARTVEIQTDAPTAALLAALAASGYPAVAV